MKNKDLIAELQKLNPDDRVAFSGYTEFEFVRPLGFYGAGYDILICPSGSSPFRIPVLGLTNWDATEPAASRMRCV